MSREQQEINFHIDGMAACNRLVVNNYRGYSAVAGHDTQHGFITIYRPDGSEFTDRMPNCTGMQLFEIARYDVAMLAWQEGETTCELLTRPQWIEEFASWANRQQLNLLLRRACQAHGMGEEQGRSYMLTMANARKSMPDQAAYDYTLNLINSLRNQKG